MNFTPLKRILLLLGLTTPVLAGPVSPPAGNFILNVSTTSSRPAFSVYAGTVTGNFNLPYLTSGQCVQTAAGGRIVGTGVPCAAGVSVYPATATVTFPFGVSATTIAVSGTISVSSITASSVSITGLNTGQCVQVGTAGLLTTSGFSCGTGSGSGGSALQVTLSGVQVTSPTTSMNFNTQGFLSGSSGATAYLSLNPATTDFIHNQTTSQTATLNVTSGTVSGSMTAGFVTSNAGVYTSTIAVSNNSNSYYGALITSTGTRNALRIVERGIPDNALQSLDGGALNITMDTNTVAPAIVIVSSSPDVQQGAGILELWQQSPSHNDPHFWIHATDHNSAGNIRVDSYAPNFEAVNLSTDNAHGLGKFEFGASPYQGATWQMVNSRCWDNSSFERIMYVDPMSQGGNIYLSPFDSTGCDSGAGYVASSQTIAINWLTLNNHTVGIRGPDNSSASWTFRLPSTFSNGGQILYQATGSTPRNWEFTTGGTAGSSLLQYNGSNTVPTWADSINITSMTVSSITASGQIVLSGNGAGQIFLTEGAASTVTPAANKDVLWADSSSHTFVYNPNNTSNYTVVGSSTQPTIGHFAAWSNQGTLIDGGGLSTIGGGIISPGTFTWTNLQGITLTTATLNYTAVTTPGTASSYPLRILPNGGSDVLNLGADASYAYIQSENGEPLQINNQGNNTLLNATAGSVGIGNTSPTEKLHVSGTIKSSLGVNTSTLTLTSISNSYLLYSSTGNVLGTGDLKLNDGNAVLNLRDASNPFSLNAGYGLKVTLQGNLGSPTTGYGVYSTMSNGTSGDEYAFYGDANGATAATNYGAKLSASGGGKNYGLLVSSGQVYIASSMTVVSAVSISSGLYLGSSAGTNGQLLTSAGPGIVPGWGMIDISAQTNLSVAGQAVLANDTLGVGPVSFSTGTIGTVDISTQTNLTASGQAVLSGDNVGVGPTSLSTGTIGTLTIATQSNLTATGNANMNSSAVNVGPIKIGSGTLGGFDVSSTSSSVTGAGGFYTAYGATVGTITVNSGVALTQSYKAALCQSGTASLGFSAFSSSAPTVSCVVSTSTVLGVANFVDASTNSVQDHFTLPTDWTGAINANLVWISTPTSGSAVWQIHIGCGADAASSAITWAAVSTVTDAAKSVANMLNTTSITGIATTGCSAGNELFFELYRDPSHASDNLNGSASLVTLQLTLRRTLSL